MPVVFDRPEKHCEKVRDNADLTLTTEYIPQVYITKERRAAVEPLSSFTLLCPYYWGAPNFSKEDQWFIRCWLLPLR